MSALALRTGSVNLGQGFPDVSGPASVLEAAYDAMRSGRNQYPPGHGAPELVAAVVRHQQRHYGLDLTPDQVVVTTGATEAIAGALLGLEATVTDRTRMILLNTPHNPTGRVLDRSELAGVAEIAQRHDLLVVTDEVYEHLTFDDHEHVPIATLPGMFDRTVTISSSGKTFSLTGWKIGWATGPADLVAAVEGAKNWLSYASGAPFQPAIAHALDHEEAFHERLRDDLSAKRDLLCAALSEIGLRVHVPEATYFVTTDVRDLGHRDGRAFCAGTAERAKVVAIPAQVLYEDGSAEGRHLVRWAFCKEPDVLDEGIRRLRAADLHA